MLKNAIEPRDLDPAPPAAPRYAKTPEQAALPPRERVSWFKSIPFLLVHVVALVLPFVVGVTWQDVALCIGLYYLRMFAITGGYHRYFSHRTYKTGRVFQFLMALLGTTCAQKGPLWWAAHHRNHHKYSDTPQDIHSPSLRGFFWSHMGWFMASRYDQTEFSRIQDFARYPELRWLNRFYIVPPLCVLVLLYVLGGSHAAVYGGLLSTVILWHGTFTINSLSHVYGSRRYKTRDTSRNNFLLALITMGEGWHNNHHYYPGSTSQGFFWWEIDMTYYVLRALSAVGIVWDLRKPPESVLRAAG